MHQWDLRFESSEDVIEFLMVKLCASAARLSGQRVKEFDDLVNPEESGGTGLFDLLKRWTILRFHEFGFFTILLFASVFFLCQMVSVFLLCTLKVWLLLSAALVAILSCCD
jgi:hypothetical protein